MNYLFRTNTLRKFVQECMRPTKTSNFAKAHTLNSLYSAYGLPAFPRKPRTDLPISEHFGRLCLFNYDFLVLPLAPLQWEGFTRYDHYYLLDTRYPDKLCPNWVNYASLKLAPIGRLDEFLPPDQVWEIPRKDHYSNHVAEFAAVEALFAHVERTSWLKSSSTHSS